MKYVKQKTAAFVLTFLLLFPTSMSLLASGTGNIDGGSGGMGSGTATDV